MSASMMSEGSRNGYQSLEAPPPTGPGNSESELLPTMPEGDGEAHEGNIEGRETPTATSTQHSSTAEMATPSQTSSRRKLDRRVPLVMGCSVAFAIAFALIHHFFYRYWNRRVVASDSQQQWIIRGGTLFAFGFKTSLVIGSGAAYVQYLWMSMRKRPFRAGEIDNMFSILTDAMNFVDIRLWIRVPLLALLALITWSIPLAAIITPGTLIVSPELQSESASQVVPSLDFQNIAATYGTILVGGGIGQFGHAQDEVIRIALASAASGTILSMEPPAPNSSYTLPFYGPALRCDKANDTEFQLLQSMASNYSRNSGGSTLAFFSWVPESQSTTGVPLFNQTDFSDAIDRTQAPGGSQISVFSTSCRYNQTMSSCQSAQPPMFLHCMLHNVSYTVNFTFQSGEQSMDIRSAGDGDPVSEWRAGSYYDPKSVRSEINKTQSYLSVMFAFNRMITGSIKSQAQVTSWEFQSTLVQSTKLAPMIATATNETLGRALEDLFQNMTFSLFSSSQFLADARNSSRAVSADVTIKRTRNIYTYDPLDLYLSYSIAVLSALVCIGIGCLALTGNGVSYSNDFTTILRTTRNRELDRMVMRDEYNGANPKAKHMTQELLSFNLSDDRNAGFQISKDQRRSFFGRNNSK